MGFGTEGDRLQPLRAAPLRYYVASILESGKDYGANQAGRFSKSRIYNRCETKVDIWTEDTGSDCVSLYTNGDQR